ncbi:hypothetical protein ACH5RR_003251 [Cinchona calisaya]|uniref:Uncharacterized protein n=1 Tax=Cinchona calisaya TaxID=153742 RepID=A0ABD3AU87_9GENT
MGVERSTSAAPMCALEEHCSEWESKYMKYCLCSTKEWVSLILGLISVMSWAVAEIPQIITIYKQKSAEGLSLVFVLFTWCLLPLVIFLNITCWPARSRITCMEVQLPHIVYKLVKSIPSLFFHLSSAFPEQIPRA